MYIFQDILTALFNLVTMPMAVLQDVTDVIPTQPPLSSIFILIVAFFVSLASTLVSRKMIDIDKLRRLTRETKKYNKLRMQMMKTADSKLKLKYERNADRMRKVQSELTMMNLKPLMIMFIPMILFFIVLSGFYSFQTGISYIGYAEATDGDSVTTMLINKPSGTLKDDLMIALVVSTIGSDNNGTSISSTPSGWTLEHDYIHNASSGNHVYIYWKIAGDSEPSNYSWTWTDNCSWIGQINSFRNINTTSPIHIKGAVQQKTEEPCVSPSVKTSQEKSMIWLYAIANSADVEDGNVPSNTKKIKETKRVDPEISFVIETAYFVQKTAGDTEAREWTDWLNQDVENSGQQLALNPAYNGKMVSGNIPAIIPFDPTFGLETLWIFQIGKNVEVQGWGLVFVPNYIWWYFGGSLAFGSILRKVSGLQPD
ncbi:MAG: EMC3/TMCO1 family protein [Promethearchaeota archaeon]